MPELDFTDFSTQTTFTIDKIIKTEKYNDNYNNINMVPLLILKGDDTCTISFDNTISGCIMENDNIPIHFQSGVYEFKNNAKFYLSSDTVANTFNSETSGFCLFNDSITLDLNGADFILKNLDSVIVEYNNIIEKKDKQENIINYIYYLKQVNSEGLILNDITATNTQLRKLVCALVYPITKKQPYPY